MTEKGRRKHILIVEDDDAVATLLERMLQVDYDVSREADGPGALAAATRNPPDLVILDVMIPGFDGLGVAHRLKLVPETRRVPFIFLTAKASPKDAARGLEAGAKADITKPFHVRDVLDRVRKLIG